MGGSLNAEIINNSVCVCVLSGKAWGSPLLAAVASYSAAASGLEDAWDSFQDAQSTAFDEVVIALTNLHDYYDELGENELTDNIRWNAQATAWSALEGATGEDVDTTFQALLAQLDLTVTSLATVLAEDALDGDFAAYSNSTTLFELPAEPFLFWYDETCPDIDEWPEFDFPLLLVGPSNSYSSYTATGLTAFAAIMTDLEGWAEFGYNVNKHKGKGSALNAAGAAIFDDLCLLCAQTTIYALDAECFTLERVGNFCEDNHTLDYCDDENVSTDRQKNAVVSTYFPCHTERNLAAVKKVAEDFIKPWWSGLIPWLWD
jgi:hypothetical protein